MFDAWHSSYKQLFGVSLGNQKFCTVQCSDNSIDRQTLSFDREQLLGDFVQCRACSLQADRHSALRQ